MNGFTAADMSTAAANWFRDGLAAQPSAAQEATGYIEFLDRQNNSFRMAIHAIMAKLAFLLDEDQFADIDRIATAAVAASAAPGIDLRNAILQLREDALHMKDPGDMVNAYDRVLRLIDASPKGGSDVRDVALAGLIKADKEFDAAYAGYHVLLQSDDYAFTNGKAQIASDRLDKARTRRAAALEQATSAGVGVSDE